MNDQHIHFVTGRLAEHSLRHVVEPLAVEVGFDYTIDVLPITVAALMTPQWIAKRIAKQIGPGSGATRVVIPGYCRGDLTPLEAATDLPVERGPRDLRRLGEFFGQVPRPETYGAHSIEIIAEINHCPQLTFEEILATAQTLASDGADIIDIGCEPGEPWHGIADVVKALCDEGHRVSVDSLNPVEIAPAVRAGAELVLSVNSTNREAACDWGCKVVVVPDDPKSLAGLDETIEFLAKAGVSLRIDPILEPIGFGFAESLGRYLNVRKRYPDAEMMMGIGNLTELTEVDSAGVNAMLLGFCQELSIHSVLTTQVINWARSSVRECDIARQLMHHAVQNQTLPKHVDPRLVMLRDASVVNPTPEELSQLATAVKDNNYRIFATGDAIHLIGAGLHLSDTDPFKLMELLMGRSAAKSLDASHAFYLGFEMHKALTALTLGKQYQQDEPLDWGFLTREESHHRLGK